VKSPVFCEAFSLKKRKGVSLLNKKALLVLFPLLATLSLTIMPVLAQVDSFAPVRACGFAYVKMNEGCVSGCATLRVFAQAPVGIGYQYVILTVKDYTFYWRITSEKLKCGILTVCASPAEEYAPAPITVVINLKAPYCVTAFGCGVFFVGKGQVLVT
jgi:hypothetical protein